MDWQNLHSEQLFMQLPEPALLVAADGRVIGGNALASTLFEQPEPFPITTVEALLTEPERARLQPLQWLRKWADRPDAPELDYVLLTGVTQSKQQLHLSARVTRLAISAGEPNFLVLLRDMGRWESRLRTERDAHRLAARLLALSTDGLVAANGTLEITHVNSSAARLFGYTAAELTGKPLASLLPERFRATHGEHMHRFAAEHVPSRTMSERGEIVGLSSSGEEIPIDASITRIALHDDVIFCAQLRDLRGRVGKQEGA